MVVHPLMFEEEDEVRKQQEPREEEEDIIALTPGTTVMTEEATALDSRSLQQIHSTICNDGQRQLSSSTYVARCIEPDRNMSDFDVSNMLATNTKTCYGI